MNTDYRIRTWANGFGRWHATVEFPNGAGNTGAGEQLIARGTRAAKRAIRREIVTRNSSIQITPLRYEVTANKSFGSGALYSITYAESE